MDRTSFGVIFGLKLLKAFQSLKGIPIKHSFLLKELIQLILFKVGLVIKQSCYIFLLLTMIELLKLAQIRVSDVIFLFEEVITRY
jgi:hypothetical protein